MLQTNGHYQCLTMTSANAIPRNWGRAPASGAGHFLRRNPSPGARSPPGIAKPQARGRKRARPRRSVSVRREGARAQPRRTGEDGGLLRCVCGAGAGAGGSIHAAASGRLAGSLWVGADRCRAVPEGAVHGGPRWRPQRPAQCCGSRLPCGHWPSRASRSFSSSSLRLADLPGHPPPRDDAAAAAGRGPNAIPGLLPGGRGGGAPKSARGR